MGWFDSCQGSEGHAAQPMAKMQEKINGKMYLLCWE